MKYESYDYWQDDKTIKDIDAFWRRSTNEHVIRRDIASRLKLSKKQSLLEAGCGSGYFYEFLGCPVNYVGLDISTPMLAIFKENYPNVELIQGNIVKLPFENNSFDQVICITVLGHFREGFAEGIRELYRVAKKKVAFTCWLSEKYGEFTHLADANSKIGYVAHKKEEVEGIIKSLPGNFQYYEMNLGRFGIGGSGPFDFQTVLIQIEKEFKEE